MNTLPPIECDNALTGDTDYQCQNCTGYSRAVVTGLPDCNFMTKELENHYFRQLTQCSGKHRYENSALAKVVAQRQRKTNDVPVNHYYCQICDGFHIGNKRKKSIKVRKRDYEKQNRREHE